LLLEAIAVRHEVHALCLRREAAAHGVPADAAIRSFERSALDRLLAMRHVLDPAFPLQSTAAWSRGLALAVRDAIRTGDFDVVHIEHIRALRYLPVHPRPPVLFDAVDCVSDLFRLAAAQQRRPLRWLYATEAGRLARAEANALAAVDRVLVASQRDATGLQQLDPRAPITVITNPVDLTRFTAGSDRRSETVVMTGKMSFHANAVAARWLCEEIWPAVRAQHPGARLAIAGAQPRSLRKEAAEDIDVIGYVDDLSGVIRSAAVAVAPLRYAVGVQNKVLEAMACATPVVATPAAVGDLDLRNGRDVLVAGDASEFAARIGFLLDNPDMAREIGNAGRRYVEAHHAPRVLADRLEAVYFELLQRTPSAIVEEAEIASGR
jgi:glycosyltransferase involved in cell wall biosynthesis